MELLALKAEFEWNQKKVSDSLQKKKGELSKAQGALDKNESQIGRTKEILQNHSPKGSPSRLCAPMSTAAKDFEKWFTENSLQIIQDTTKVYKKRQN